MSCVKNLSSSREYPDRPFISVCAIIWKDDKVLLTRRGKEPRKGEWSFPGGAQDTGETALEALHREIAEETGLEIEIGPLIEVIDSITKDDNDQVQYHYTILDYVARHKHGTAVAADDVSEVMWTSLKKALSLLKWHESRRVLEKSAECRNFQPTQ
jgi:8-oxo-dGTP diphosphatase